MSPRTKIQNSQIRKETESKILDAALEVFSEKGYFNSSIRNIAKTAKISDGLLYSYYTSKEQLATEVLKSAFETLDKTIIDSQKNDPKENIKISIIGFIDLLKNEQSKIRLLAQMGLHKEKFELLNTITTKKYEHSIEKFESSFNQIGLKNPKTEARFLVATLDGIAFECLLMERPFDLKTIEKELLDKYCYYEN